MFSLDYLEENYKLRLGKKDLEELSPGERGALLLVFYLMLDKNDIPLVIDQPEDNLDNQSVAQILVPFIKEAKTKRQIIMVTHSPNLAVVADAEQIIYVSIDKKSVFIPNPLADDFHQYFVVNSREKFFDITFQDETFPISLADCS